MTPPAESRSAEPPSGVPSRPGIYISKSSGWDDHGWTSVPNMLLRDRAISWEAKGAFGWIASHREMIFRLKGDDLADAGPKGRDHARKMRRELEAAGWLSRAKHRNPDTGRWDIVVWTLHPLPVPAEQRTCLAA
jgi:hypothetical protein